MIGRATNRDARWRLLHRITGMRSCSRLCPAVAWRTYEAEKRRGRKMAIPHDVVVMNLRAPHSTLIAVRYTGRG